MKTELPKVRLIVTKVKIKIILTLIKKKKKVNQYLFYRPRSTKKKRNLIKRLEVF